MARKTLEIQLDEAIELGDIAMVKTINEKIKKKNKPKKIRKKKVVEVELEQEEVIEEDTEIISNPTNDDDSYTESKGKQCRTEPFNNKEVRKNLFKDTLKDAKKDLKIAKSAGVSPRGTKYKPVVVVCRVCNKKFKVSPDLAGVNLGGERTTFRCNNCCSGK